VVEAGHLIATIPRSLGPLRKEANLNIADLYLKLGRRAEARQHYEQFLTLNPNSPRAEDVRRILQGLSSLQVPAAK
jgi:tetratricopeptide (TPR) repeat protein